MKASCFCTGTGTVKNIVATCVSYLGNAEQYQISRPLNYNRVWDGSMPVFFKLEFWQLSICVDCSKRLQICSQRKEKSIAPNSSRSLSDIVLGCKIDRPCPHRMAVYSIEHCQSELKRLERSVIKLHRWEANITL